MNNKKLSFIALIFSLLNMSICHTCMSLKDNLIEDISANSCKSIYKGNTIDVAKIPRVTLISNDILEIFTQNGTGLGASQCVYYDLIKEQFSQTFSYVITSVKDCVVYADYSDGIHKIIVRNIFDENLYVAEYELVDCCGSDFIVDFRFNNSGELIVEYLTSENGCSTKSITIGL